MATITFPVEATHIMMFARSIGDENPVYHDADKAKWMPIASLRQKDFFEDHYDILINMLARI